MADRSAKDPSPPPREACGSPEDRSVADGRDDKDAGVRGAPIGLGGPGGFRLELVLRPEGATAAAYPFVTLGSTGRYARVHLARIVNSDGMPIRYIALKVQRDRYDVETDRGNVLANGEVAQLWKLEYENLRGMAGDPESPAAELLAAGRELEVIPPLLYCRKREVFFHPPCPSCSGLLRDCEDESILTRRGLPRHSESNIRYLHCAACHRARPDAPLYRQRADDRDRRAGVKDLKALLADWRDLVRKKPEGAAGGGEDAAAAFPCPDCELADGCFGGTGQGTGSAERIVALSFHDFRALPLEVLRLHYDEFADCLGGIGWADLVSEHRGGREAIPERLFLADFRRQLERPDRFLFSGLGGLEAVEVFRLKLALFSQLCRRARAFHAGTGGPHLDLKPENAMVDIPPLAADLPYLWSFRVKLVDLAGTTRFALGDDGAPRWLPAPPVNYSEAFTAPAIRGGQFGHLKHCDVRIGEVTDAGDGRHGFRARVRSPDLIAEEYTDKDVFRISLPAGEVGEAFTLWASKDTGGEASPGAMDLAGVPAALGPAAEALRSIAGQWIRGANLETYHAFGPPCDLYSLGVILLRTLLCGKKQNLAMVATKLLAPAVNELERLADTGTAPSAFPSRVREILGANPCARPEMVYWDGNPARPSAIPRDLWVEALALAVRLCTSFPGFSFAAGRGDWDPARPEATLDRVLADLDGLAARVHAALFFREELNREVREAIDRVRARLAGSAGKGG